ncbi:MAG: trypsin-like peptidase domain-containing protein [Ilumatobacter sp.]|uniref:trypsin-like peptidase domain-containing protein n=1 Tax=Ilumatobacter sp. TaxID=1967498 RepID=UPI003C72000A
MTASDRSSTCRCVVSFMAAISLLATSCAEPLDADEPSDVALSGVGVVAEGCGLAKSVGSGVVVDRGDGEAVVVTAAHTIKGATGVVVVDADGNENMARVVAFDKDADLAALTVIGLAAPAVEVTTNPVSVVEGASGSILTWGRDDGVEEVPVVITKRLLVTIEDIYVDDVIERTALELAGPVAVGDSGGPVLDEAGDVVGIVYANSRGREQVGFATDQVEVAALLAAVGSATVANGTCA